MSKTIKISVAGCGFVGSAVAEGFSSIANIYRYDIDKQRGPDPFEDIIRSHFVFVCLPTPMVSVDGGEANLSIIYDFFEKVSQAKVGNDTVFIIKSTVPVGTTKDISEKFGITKIVHNPEFLTEKNAINDFLNPSRIVIGGEDITSVYKVLNLYKERFPDVECHVMGSKDSEMVKYTANCFLATKLSFFNEMKLFADKKNLQWEKVVDAVLADPRIGKSHYRVPWSWQDMGWGGTCVLPDMTMKIRDKSHGNIYFERNITIYDAYNLFHTSRYVMETESCDSDFSEKEWKEIENITRREVEEMVIWMDTSGGLIKCTKEHLFPVLRENNICLLRADMITKKDKLPSKIRPDKNTPIYYSSIKDIFKTGYFGFVYNLELKSNSYKDDLFWREQNTGIYVHNCFPKDVNALIRSFYEENIEPMILNSAWELNKKVRKNWDWATRKSAVLEKK